MCLFLSILTDYNTSDYFNINFEKKHIGKRFYAYPPLYKFSLKDASTKHHCSLRIVDKIG